MNFNMNYFYTTIHFSPKYDELNLIKVNETTFKKSDCEIYYTQRLLYDFGWGQELGWELQPKLMFSQLIELVIHYEYENCTLNQSDKFSNLLGAVSVIMQDYTEELITFLDNKLTTNFFDNKEVRENFKWFCFEKGKGNPNYVGGIGTKSYEEVLNQYPKWKAISSRVKVLAYRD